MKKVFLITIIFGIVVGQSHATDMRIFTKTTELARVVFIQHQGSFAEIPSAMDRLHTWAKEKDYTMVGPPVGIYFDDPNRVPEDSLRWEIEWPIAEDVGETEPSDGIGVREVEPMLVAATYHKGPYDEVAKSYMALFGWMAQNGYEVAGPVREVYWSDPEKSAEEELVSEIQIPVKKKAK
jgi:effector-binding domain-containing protein